MAREIDRAVQKLGPEVVKVRYTIGPDSGGDPSIDFRIVLTDEASREENLGEVNRTIVKILRGELHPSENWGMHLYTTIRSQSEDMELSDPMWM